MDAPLPGVKGEGDGLLVPVVVEPDAVPLGTGAVVLPTGYGFEAGVVTGVITGAAGVERVVGATDEVATVVGALVAGCEAAEELPPVPPGASQKMVSI